MHNTFLLYSIYLIVQVTHILFFQMTFYYDRLQEWINLYGQTGQDRWAILILSCKRDTVTEYDT